MKTFIRFFIYLFVCGQSLLAQPGSPDDDFGTGGVVVTNIGPGSSNDIAYSIAQQPDGKLLVAGFAVANNVGSFAVVRYLPDGNKDDSFGNEGIVTVGFTGGFAQAIEVLLLPDGKILLAGSVSGTSGGDFGLVRLLPDGSLDTGFGNGGKVVADASGGYDSASAALLQPDGKVVVVGAVYGTTVDIVICRFNADGSLDNGFGLGGKVLTTIADEDQPTCVALQSDGKIVVAGYASFNAVGDFALLRYTSNGVLDTGFGPAATGIVKLDLQGFNYSDLAKDLAILPDGSILVVGLENYYNLGQIADVGIVKFDANGLLDNSFGSQGVVVADIGNVLDVSDLEVLPNGHFFVAGRTDEEGNQNRWMLAKFQADGTLDGGFGNGGIVTTALSGPQEVALCMAVQPDGKVVLAGKTGETSGADFAVARYHAAVALTVKAIVSNVSCNGGADGFIIIELVGGSPPYQYSLDGTNYQAENSFNNLVAGSYTVRIKDENGVVVNVDIEINEPALPTITVNFESSQITIVNSDNTGSYQYSIDGGISFQSSNVFSNLTGLNFPIVVLNENGCEVYNDVLLIFATDEAVGTKASLLNVWPNPSNGKFSFETKLPMGDYQISVTDAVGKRVFNGSTNVLPATRNTLDLSGLANGCYLLRIGNEQKWAVQRLVIVK